MGQLLLMVVVPPIVGLVAYAVVRLLRERAEEKSGGPINHQHPRP